eukprot:332224_1
MSNANVAFRRHVTPAVERSTAHDVVHTLLLRTLDRIQTGEFDNLLQRTDGIDTLNRYSRITAQIRETQRLPLSETRKQTPRTQEMYNLTYGSHQLEVKPTAKKRGKYRADANRIDAKKRDVKGKMLRRERDMRRERAELMKAMEKDTRVRKLSQHARAHPRRPAAEPLHVRMEREFQRKIVQSELDRRREKLTAIHSAYKFEGNARPTRRISQRKRDIPEAQSEFARERGVRDRELLQKQAMAEKRRRYAAEVRQRFPPKVDPAKRKQSERRRIFQRSSSVPIARIPRRPSVANKAERKRRRRRKSEKEKHVKFPPIESKPIPAPIDYLAELRAKRGKRLARSYSLPELEARVSRLRERVREREKYFERSKCEAERENVSGEALATEVEAADKLGDAYIAEIQAKLVLFRAIERQQA